MYIIMSKIFSSQLYSKNRKGVSVNDIDSSQFFSSEPNSIPDHLIVHEILFFQVGGGGEFLGVFFRGGGSSSLFTRN